MANEVKSAGMAAAASSTAADDDRIALVETVDRLGRALARVRVLAEAGKHYVDQNEGCELRHVDIAELFDNLDDQQQHAVDLFGDVREFIARGAL